MTEATSPAAPAPATVNVPVKPATASVSVWAGIASFVLGLAVQFGAISADTAAAVGANLNDVIGAVMVLIGALGTFGALRRRSVLKF